MNCLISALCLLAGVAQASWIGGTDQQRAKPSRIYRMRITMTATKQFMDVSFSRPQIFDFYNFHVRWAEPFQWNDVSANGGSGRRYELHCWVRDQRSGDTKTIFRRDINSLYTGYHEKLRFPPSMDLIAQCEVQAINALQLSSGWVASNTIRVQDVPVYLPGIPDVNVRGLSDEDLLAVLANIAEEASDYYDDENAEEASTTTRRVTTTRRPTTTRRTTTTQRPTTTTTTRSTTTTSATTTATTTTTTTRRPTKTTTEFKKPMQPPVDSVAFRQPIPIDDLRRPVFRPAIVEPSHDNGQVRKLIIANNWQRKPVNTEDLVASRRKNVGWLTEAELDRQVEKLRRRHTNYILSLDN